MNFFRKKPWWTETVLPVPLDAATEARLRRLAVVCGDDPVAVASSLLHDILLDDELAHVTLH